MQAQAEHQQRVIEDLHEQLGASTAECDALRKDLAAAEAAAAAARSDAIDGSAAVAEAAALREQVATEAARRRAAEAALDRAQLAAARDARAQTPPLSPPSVALRTAAAC